MAIKFFWRCEGTTLDATHDYTVGSDTTATAQNGNISITTPGIVGTNAAIRTGDGRFYFDTDATFAAGLNTEGSMAFLVRPETFSHAGNLLQVRFANYQYSIGVNQYGGDGTGVTAIFGSEITDARSFNYSLPGAFQASTVYGIVLRWRRSDLRMRLEVYDSGGTLLGSGEQTFASFITMSEAGTSDGILVGGQGTGAIDNVFIADAYDEPLEDNLFITSYTAYGGAAAVPTISSVTPSTITAGSNPVIAGTNFEASQGTGTVKLSPTDNVADAAVEVQGITTWNDGDPGITTSGVTFPAGTSHGDTLYYFVTNDSGDTNETGYPVTVSLQAVLPSITLYDIDGQTALPTPLTSVRWAWFDAFPDGSGAMTPVNSGTGLTITNGALSLTVNNSYLVSGEYGMLLLEEPVSGRRQAYRLQVV